MIKTLKGKLSLIYIVLILLMTFIGGISIRNLLVISNDINGLLSNNYKSIQAVKNMKDSLSSQQHSLFSYLSGDEDSLVAYSNYNYTFQENFHLEKNNITEEGEREFVDSLNKNYLEYNNSFYRLIDIINNEGRDVGLKFFLNDITDIYNRIMNDLNSINVLNENIMIDSKARVGDKASIIVNITVLITLISVIISFFGSKHFLKKLLNPLNNIITGIKHIKISSNYVELDIISEDELGELTNEFNLMTKRLQSFEESTLGQILKERNNSNSILKSIDSPMVVIDKDYRVTMVNSRFVQAFNINDDKIVGRYLNHLIKDRNFFTIIYDITINNCEGDLMNIITLKDENNESFYYNISIKEIKEDEIEIGYVILLKDITHLKQVELISKDFFTTISHEFKTPLTSIMIGTGLLESSKVGSLNDEQIKILNTIKEDGERLNLLVSNMLLLSKLDSSNAIYKKEEQAPLNLVETSVSNNIENANHHGIILEYSVDFSLPPLICDGEKIVWVLNNLITNSIRHCSSGDLISIRGVLKDNSLQITVTDTGAGILKEHNELIFNKYAQSNSQNVKTKSGLGLWICRDIITAHNGSISCESDLGEGATFTIIIPYN